MQRRHTYKNHKPGGKDYKENVRLMRSVNAHYVNAFKDLQHSGELLHVTLASVDDILQAQKISAQTELMKCEFCEYSAHNFNDFEKQMYEKHRTGGGNDHKAGKIIVGWIMCSTGKGNSRPISGYILQDDFRLREYGKR